MVQLIKVGNSYNSPSQKFVCDSVEDLYTIDTFHNVPVGSKATVLNETKVYVKAPNGEWCVLTSGSGGGQIIPERLPWAHSKEGF